MRMRLLERCGGAACAVLLALAMIACDGAHGRGMTLYRDPSRATPSDPVTAMRLNAAAASMIRHGKLDEAIETLRRAVQADMGCGPAHNNLGVAHFRQGRMYEAAWEFQYASSLMPGRSEPRSNLGMVMERVGQLEEAAQHYRDAQRSAPDDPQVIGNLARALVRRGERTPELVELLDALALRETRPEWIDWAIRERAATMARLENDAASP